MATNFIDGQTVVTAAWLNSVDAAVNQTGTGVGAALIPFTPTGIGAVPTTVATFLQAFKQYPTNQVFSDLGANINRINDRLFVGGACVSDGTSTETTKNWAEAFYANLGETGAYGTANVVSLNGSNSLDLQGGLFGAQSLNITAYGCIGLMGLGLNNSSSNVGGAWGLYTEGHRTTAGSGNAYGAELDIRNVGSSVTSGNPYSQTATVALQLASGAGVGGTLCTGVITGNTLLTVSGAVPLLGGAITVGMYVRGVGVTPGTTITSFGTGTGGNGTYNITSSANVTSRSMVITNQFDSGAAIQIEPNPSMFQTGIVFGAQSLTGADGINGTATAVSMAIGHQLNWYFGSGNLAASVYAQTTVANRATQLLFNNNGANFTDYQGNTVFNVQYGTTAIVNSLSIGGTASGGGQVIVQTLGGDTNIDLDFVLSGTGVMKFGTYTAGVVAQAGYVTIKDSGGTVRRLLVG